MRNQIAVLLILVVFTLFTPSLVFAQPTNNPIYNITTKPEKILFDISDFAPGDWSEKIISLKNIGSKTSYTMELNHKSGSEKLFNEFFLNIEYENKELFNGKIKDFDGLKQSIFEEKESHEYVFTVTFPHESGNNFQGLKTEFELIIKAKGNESVSTPEQSGVLPNTAGNAYDFILYGLFIFGIGIVVFLSQKINRKMGD
ncbi:hypothetical protein [Bacillus sp. m3-13]|uniref:hypothetical protein n=1 Tax=Bacillus sp. m3-13 TaxID=406124 RepID=UPI0001E89CD1|nr:hypothetical protein [Bacillus sp. m3-13]